MPYQTSGDDDEPAGPGAAAQPTRPAPPEAQSLARVAAVMARLRGPSGCPWDRAQTFATIAPYTVEEAHEVADAIARGDRTALRDELGDLLLQVLFHAQMAAEEGAFDLVDVVDGLADKLVRRHPHVFAAAAAAGPEEVAALWQQAKDEENGAGRSLLDGIAAGMPALVRARKLGERAARAGFDWPDAAGARHKVLEEMDELEAAASPDERLEEAGDLLLAMTSWLRHLGMDGETALAMANAKFERRFRLVEQAPGFGSLSPAEQETLWQQAKAG